MKRLVWLFVAGVIMFLAFGFAAAADAARPGELTLGPSESLGSHLSEWPAYRRPSQQAPKPYGYDFQHRFGRAYSHPAWIGPYEYGYTPYFGIESDGDESQPYEPWSQDGWPDMTPIPAPPEPEEDE